MKTDIPQSVAVQIWTDLIRPALDLRPSGCMEWRGLKLKGYGVITRFGTTLRVHRIALQVKLGAPLGNLKACHKCDNPACANPAHLWRGTDNDNRRDAIAKGRSVFGVKGQAFSLGENAPSAKLNAQSVREIRKRHSAGESLRNLATAFGVTRGPIWKIVNRKTWSHIN